MINKNILRTQIETNLFEKLLSTLKALQIRNLNWWLT